MRRLLTNMFIAFLLFGCERTAELPLIQRLNNSILNEIVIQSSTRVNEFSLILPTLFKTTDTIEFVYLLNQLTENSDRHLEVMNKCALELSAKCQNPQNKIEARFQRAIIIAKRGAYDSSNSDLRKTINDPAIANYPELQAKGLSLIAEGERYKGKRHEALYNYKKAIQIAGQVGDKKRIAFCLNKIGVLFNDSGLSDSAGAYYRRSIFYAKSSSDYSRLASVYFGMGELDQLFSYETRGQYLDSAICYAKLSGRKKQIANALFAKSYLYAHKNLFVKCLESALHGKLIAEELRDTSLLLLTSRVFSRFYFENKNNNESESFCLKGLKLIRGHKDQVHKDMLLITMGQIALERKRYDDALKWLRQNRNNDNFTLSLIAKTVSGLGDTLQALELFNDVIEKCKESKEDNYHAFALIESGKINLARKKYKKAQEMLEVALVIANKIHIPEHQMNACYSLAMVNEKLGLVKEAYKHQKLFMQIRDSTLNLEKVKQIELISYRDKEGKLLASQKVREIIFQRENSRKEFELKSKQNTIHFFIAGLLIVIALSLYVIFLLQRSYKQNKLITSQKIEIEKKQEELMSSIRYASRIQKALMPAIGTIQKTLGRLT